jgi:hypothetical protein
LNEIHQNLVLPTRPSALKPAPALGAAAEALFCLDAVGPNFLLPARSDT